MRIPVNTNILYNIYATDDDDHDDDYDGDDDDDDDDIFAQENE